MLSSDDLNHLIFCLGQFGILAAMSAGYEQEYLFCQGEIFL